MNHICRTAKLSLGLPDHLLRENLVEVAGVVPLEVEVAEADKFMSLMFVSIPLTIFWVYLFSTDSGTAGHMLTIYIFTASFQRRLARPKGSLPSSW